MTDEVFSLRVEDQLSAGADAAAAALDRVGAAAEATETKVTRSERSWTSLANKVDPVARAAANTAREEARLAAAMEVGRRELERGTISVTDYDRAIAAQTGRVIAAQRAQAELTGTLTGNQSVFQATTAAIDRMRTAQQAYNAATGVRQPLGGGDLQRRAADIAAYGSELDRLRARFVPVFAVSKQYETTLEEIAHAHKVGAISASERAAAEERATTAFQKSVAPATQHVEAIDGVADASKNASVALRGLGLQSIDMAQQIASGAPVLTTLVQQGGQVAQVAVASGQGLSFFGRAGAAALAGLMSPIGAVVAGFAALAAGVAYLGYQSEAAQRQMASLRNTLAATRTDYVAMSDAAERAARAAARTSPAGLDEARAAATAFAAQPSFVGTTAQLESLVKVANDVAARLGISLPEAAAKLAPAMRDAAAVTREWQDRLIGLDGEFTRSIESQVRAGDAAGAYARLIDRLKTSTEGAAEAAQSKLSKALDDLARQFVADQGPGTFGKALTDFLAGSINLLTDIVGYVKKAGGLIADALPGSGTVGANAPGGRRAGTFRAANEALANSQGAAIFDAVAAQSVYSADQLAFGRRTMLAESGGNPLAVSKAGAIGLMGLMPATAAGLGADPNDPRANVDAGLKYIAQLWSRYGGDPVLVAMAYNWGPGNLDKFLANTQTLDQVPAETRAHVLKVTGVDLAGRYTAAPAVNLGTVNVTAAAGNDVGVTNLANQTIEAALTKARASGGDSAQTQRQALEDIQSYRQALKLLADQGVTTGEKVRDLQEAILKASRVAVDAIGPVGQLVRGIEDQAGASQRMTAAYGQGWSAAARMTAQLRAEESARTVAGRGTAEYTAIVARLTGEYENQARALAEQEAARKTLENADQVALLQAETETLGMASDARDVYLARLRAELELKRQAIPVESQVGQAFVESATAVANATAELNRNRAAMAEVEQTATSVFDNIANAASQSFLSGTGAAVNWANVTRAALAQVANEAIKLTALNPALNSLFGGNRPTLTSVTSALSSLGGSDTATTGGSGLLGQANNLLSLGSLGDKLGLTNIGSKISGVTDYLGITGAGGLLNLPLWEGPAGSLATTAGAEFGPMTAAAVEAGAPVTLGSVLGGVGAGFGAGSLVGGFVQDALGKTGPAPTIGAGLGAAAGVAATLIPGVGAIVGPLLAGLLGGGAGGLLGGLIGPKPASPYSSTGVTVNDAGLLGVGQTLSQITDTAAEVAGLRTQVDQLNAILSANNVRIANGSSVDNYGQTRLIDANSGSWLQIGQNSPDGTPDPSKYADLNAAFGGLRFTSADSGIAHALDGKSFASVSDLANALQAVADTAARAAAFLDQTVPGLTSLSDSAGSVATQTANINAQYEAAIQAARDLQASGTLSADTNARLARSETDLAQARDEALAKVEVAARATVDAFNADLSIRQARARAALSGQSSDALAADLAAFDTQAKAQLDSLKTAYTGLFGDAATSTQEYAAMAADLEATLASERLGIQKTYNDKAVAEAQAAADKMAAAQGAVQNAWNAAADSATATIRSLTQFTVDLQLGDASPLSVQDRYAFAQTRFADYAQRAANADAGAIGGFQQVVSDFLGASRALNGSGTNYARDFADALAAIDSISQIPADVLTASVYVAQSKDATAAIVTALDGTATIFTTETKGAQHAVVDATTGAATLVTGSVDAVGRIFGTGLTDAQRAIVTAMLDAAGATIDATAASGSGVAGAVGSLGDLFGSGLTDAQRAIVAATLDTATATLASGANLRDAMGGIGVSLTDAQRAIVTAMLDAAAASSVATAASGSDVANAVGAVGDLFGAGLTDTQRAIVAATLDAAARSADATASAGSLLAAAMDSATGVFDAGLTGTQRAIVAAMLDAAGATIDATAASGSDVAGAVGSLGDLFGGGLSDAQRAIVAATLDAAGATLSTGADLRGAMGAVGDGLTNAQRAIVAAMLDAAAISSATTSASGSDVAGAVGAIGDLFGSGLSSTQRAIVAATLDAATSSADATAAAGSLLAAALDTATGVFDAGLAGTSRVIQVAADGTAQVYQVEAEASTRALVTALGDLHAAIGTESRALIEAVGSLNITPNVNIAGPIVNIPAPIVNVASPTVNVPAAIPNVTVQAASDQTMFSVRDALTGKLAEMTKWQVDNDWSVATWSTNTLRLELQSQTTAISDLLRQLIAETRQISVGGTMPGRIDGYADNGLGG